MPCYGVHQVTFCRTIFRFIPFLLFALYNGSNPLKTNKIKENILRSILAACGTYAFMCAYNYSAMTDVFVIGLTTAIFVLPLSVLILKEKFYFPNAIAVLLGFSGICVALKPGSGVFQIGILFAAAGAIISALNQVIIKKLSSTENEMTIIFYHHLTLILLSCTVGWSSFVPLQENHAIVLFVGGIIGAMAQYAIIHAFKLSTSSGLASASYIMLIPNTLFDLCLYGKVPDLNIIAGLFLILIGIVKAFSLQSKLR